jgi:hypothetical protein
VPPGGRAARRGTRDVPALAAFERVSAPLWSRRLAELARIGGRAPSGDELTMTERRIAGSSPGSQTASRSGALRTEHTVRAR